MNINEINSLYWQPKRSYIGEIVENIDDINQCISTILETRKGSVPHNPEFGSNVWMWIDAPVDEARPNIIKEAIEAIEEWEPRVDISKVTVNIEESTLILRVEWIIKDGEEIMITEVKYNVA